MATHPWGSYTGLGQLQRPERCHQSQLIYSKPKDIWAIESYKQGWVLSKLDAYLKE